MVDRERVEMALRTEERLPLFAEGRLKHERGLHHPGGDELSRARTKLKGPSPTAHRVARPLTDFLKRDCLDSMTRLPSTSR
jgi:hypothetical protein